MNIDTGRMLLAMIALSFVHVLGGLIAMMFSVPFSGYSVGVLSLIGAAVGVLVYLWPKGR